MQISLIEKNIISPAIRRMVGINISVVSEQIHSEDVMLKKDNAKHYHEVGLNAINIISAIMLLANKKKNDINTVLDFGCGYGRVQRFLRAAFPSSQIYACDIERSQIEFCTQTFNAVPVAYNGVLETLNIDNTFDLIWLGSVFTHFKIDRIEQHIHKLSGMLNERGLLVFTSGGRRKYRKIKDNVIVLKDQAGLGQLLHDVEKTGSGYYSTGLPTADTEYGQSVTLPSAILQLIEKTGNIRLCFLGESLWDANQDIFALIKENDWAGESKNYLSQSNFSLKT